MHPTKPMNTPAKNTEKMIVKNRYNEKFMDWLAKRDPHTIDPINKKTPKITNANTKIGKLVFLERLSKNPLNLVFSLTGTAFTGEAVLATAFAGEEVLATVFTSEFILKPHSVQNSESILSSLPHLGQNFLLSTNITSSILKSYVLKIMKINLPICLHHIHKGL